MTELALVLSIFAVAMAFTAIARSGGGRSRTDALNEVRLSRVERRLQEVASFVGLPAEAVPARPSPAVSMPPSAGGSGELSPAVLDLLAAGQKIQAIKQYRIETGAGLKEAKDAVEAAEAGFASNG